MILVFATLFQSGVDTVVMSTVYALDSRDKVETRRVSSIRTVSLACQKRGADTPPLRSFTCDTDHGIATYANNPAQLKVEQVYIILRATQATQIQRGR
jgi:hypothetical protein